MSLGLRTALSATPLALRALQRVPARSLLSARNYTRDVPLRSPSLLARRPASLAIGRRFNSSTPSPFPQGSSSSSSSSSTPPEEPKSAYARFKALTKTYGSYAIIMYLALSAVDFTLSFALVHAVGADHIEPYTHYLVKKYREIRYGATGAAALEAADEARKLADAADEAAEIALAGGRKAVPWYSNKTLWAEIALAYSIHKVGLLPVRAGLTVAWTPKVVNFLRARGWIGTAGAKRAVQHGTDRMREAGQRAMQSAKDAARKQ